MQNKVIKTGRTLDCMPIDTFSYINELQGTLILKYALREGFTVEYARYADSGLFIYSWRNMEYAKPYEFLI